MSPDDIIERGAKNHPILVVDDDRYVASSLSRLLKRRGHDVVVALSYGEAQQLQGPFLVGVFDINLGNHSGVDLAARFSEGGAVHHCVFMTGYATPEQMEGATALGPVFAKNGDPRQLVTRVTELARSADPTGEADRPILGRTQDSPRPARSQRG